MRLLGELGIMRVVDRDQAKIVGGFTSTTRVNTRLLILVRAGLLRRFFIGIGGSKKAFYSLSPQGASIAGVRFRTVKREETVPLHRLRINDVYCKVKYEPFPLGTSFALWKTFFEPIDELRSLIPDGYCEVTTPEGIMAMFVELDLGNEGLRVWREKVQKYVSYALSGLFDKQTGITTGFRVLVVTNSDRRRRALQVVTASVIEKIFWFGTMDAVARHGIWGPIWLRPRGDAPRELLLFRPKDIGQNLGHNEGTTAGRPAREGHQKNSIKPKYPDEFEI